MACFLVPTAEAIVTTMIEKKVKSKECKAQAAGGADAARTPLSQKLHRLNTMLWGGSALLLFEHIWHGEIILAFPFLTAGLDEAAAEMSTVGVGMAALCTLAWAGVTAVTDALERSAHQDPASAGEAAE